MYVFKELTQDMRSPGLGGAKPIHWRMNTWQRLISRDRVRVCLCGYHGYLRPQVGRVFIAETYGIVRGTTKIAAQSMRIVAEVPAEMIRRGVEYVHAWAVKRGYMPAPVYRVREVSEAGLYGHPGRVRVYDAALGDGTRHGRNAIAIIWESGRVDLLGRDGEEAWADAREIAENRTKNFERLYAEVR